MKTSMSRAVVSRTFARVRSRISSIGSATSQGIDDSKPTTNPSPDTPPHIPPPPRVSSLLLPATADSCQEEEQEDDDDDDDDDDDGTSSPRSPSTSCTKVNQPERRGGEVGAEGRFPQISTLVITPSTWTIFANPSYPDYAATAYVQFTLNCRPQNAAAQVHHDDDDDDDYDYEDYHDNDARAVLLLNNVPGILLNLSLELSITGAHTVIQDFTQYALPRLEPDGTWLCLVHLAFNETSLASKLAASWKSLKSRTSRSLKSYNLETIDRWLDILSTSSGVVGREKDCSDGNSNSYSNSNSNTTRQVKNGLLAQHEDVVVRMRVRYQHSFFSDGEVGGSTWLEDRAECRVNMMDDNGGWATSKDDVSAVEEGMLCDDGKEEDDMMVRECNLIVGPPFML